MSFGAGDGSGPVGPGGILASEADREACQAELKQAYEDQRLTLEEFEARVGRAVEARTQGELAQLTRDLPQPVTGQLEAPPGRSRLVWLLPVGIGAVVLIGQAVGHFQAFSSGSAPPVSVAPAKQAQPPQAVPTSSGPAGCPVGTSPIALAVANALATNPVYVDPRSSMLTGGADPELNAWKRPAASPTRTTAPIPTGSSQTRRDRPGAGGASSWPVTGCGRSRVSCASSPWVRAATARPTLASNSSSVSR